MDNLIPIAGFTITSMFGILLAVTGWVGARVIVKQDELLEKLDDVKDELHKRVNGLEYRMIRIETLVYGE